MRLPLPLNESGVIFCIHKGILSLCELNLTVRLLCGLGFLCKQVHDFVLQDDFNFSPNYNLYWSQR